MSVAFYLIILMELQCSQIIFWHLDGKFEGGDIGDLKEGYTGCRKSAHFIHLCGYDPTKRSMYGRFLDLFQHRRSLHFRRSQTLLRSFDLNALKIARASCRDGAPAAR